MSKEFGSEELLIVSKLDKFNKFLRGKKIGNDIDNTDVATNAGGIVLVNKKYSTNFTIDDLTYDFEIIDLLAKNVKSIKDPKAEAITIWNSDENVCNANPMQGALLVSKYLSDNGINNIHRVTQRPCRIKNQTNEWYRTRMPWVDRSLIHIQPESSKYDEFYKFNTVKEIGFDLFFEDSIPQAEMIDKQTNTTVVLIPQKSNQGYVPKPDSRIITIPDYYCPILPSFVRAYYFLAGVVI